jgi:hypothetical protein
MVGVATGIYYIRHTRTENPIINNSAMKKSIEAASNAQAANTSYNGTVSFLTNYSSYTVYVQVANTFREREQGLMNRTYLAPDAGMLFVFGQPGYESFWMHNTQIPLDMVFISDNMTINAINANSTPENDATYTAPCEYVCEVNGNYCQEHDITIGDKVNIDLPPVNLQ